MTQVTVLTGVRRRRDWTDQDRLEILREAFSPGACVADVARRHDVSRGLIYLWRRAALRQVQETFVPAVIEDEPGTTASASVEEPEAAIVLDCADGRRLRIFASASPALAVAQVEQCRRNTQGTRAGKYLILLGVGLGAKPDVLTTFCL